MDASDSKTGKALLAGTAALAVCAIRKNIRQEESNTEQPGHLTGVRKTGLDRNYEMSICQAGLDNEKPLYSGFH